MNWLREFYVNSTFCARALTVTAILSGFEAFVGVKILENCPTLTGARRTPATFKTTIQLHILIQ